MSVGLGVDVRLMMAARGFSEISLWLLLAGCLFALAFPSIVSTETFFEIDSTIVRMMAAALGAAAVVMLADHYRLIDIV